MAMTIRPTDGLVTRLLQEQTRHSSVPSKSAESNQEPADQVSISQQARQQGKEVEAKQESVVNAYGYKQEKLENQLITLYTQHEKPGA